MRSARRLGLLLVAVTFAATAQLVATHAEASADRADGGQVAHNAVTRHDHSVVPLSRLARAGRAVGNAVQGSPAIAFAIAALAGGWLLRVARRRDRCLRTRVAFRRRGPPLPPVVI